jgi:hypothetical protein
MDRNKTHKDNNSMRTDMLQNFNINHISQFGVLYILCIHIYLRIYIYIYNFGVIMWHHNVIEMTL